MCLTRGSKSRRNYERVAQAPRPVPIAPVYRADMYEKPRRAPPVPLPPSSQARKRTEARVKKALRDAEKVDSNRRDQRFATSDKNADKIRERVLAKARENKARAPPPPPPTARIVVDSDSDSDSHKSAYVAPLKIRKKAPQPPQQQQHQQQQQHRAPKPAELGNTVPALRATARPVESRTHPALRSTAKPVDQSHIHPALRTTARPKDQRHMHPALRTSARQVDQSHIHPALRTTGGTALPSSIHPALRNFPATPSRPQRRVSDASQSCLDWEIFSHLGSPENQPNSPRESEVSPINVTQKLPYAASRKRR
ncbi:hypothetical protein F5883DRAFT_260408 [Diaporthe sp. PMI_573]|nr:hypothetical protein F5883DRAFT_260408 [Diaporthaceae sp. PMI_573]